MNKFELLNHYSDERRKNLLATLFEEPSGYEDQIQSESYGSVVENKLK